MVLSDLVGGGAPRNRIVLRRKVVLLLVGYVYDESLDEAINRQARVGFREVIFAREGDQILESVRKSMAEKLMKLETLAEEKLNQEEDMTIETIEEGATYA